MGKLIDWSEINEDQAVYEKFEHWISHFVIH